MVTLFHFMIINNWQMTIEMYQAVMESKFFPLFFFTCFYVTVVLILLNVVLSMVLEIYSSVEPEVVRNSERVKLSKNLKMLVENLEHAQHKGAVEETVNEEFKVIRNQLLE